MEPTVLGDRLAPAAIGPLVRRPLAAEAVDSPGAAPFPAGC
ncbi:hypothetical protein [Streptomyces griseofuscus]